MSQRIDFFNELAEYFPYLSPPEDYAEEASWWLRAIQEHFPGKRPRVLELGSGSGHNLHHLLPYVDAVATDLSPAMLAMFRRLNPSVPTIAGDMRHLRTGELFDAVLIHDAICHINTAADLAATFATARAHLRPGGLLLVAPDDTTETFSEPRILHRTTARGAVHFSFVRYDWDPDPTDTSVEYLFHYFIREGNAALRVLEETQVMGLFPKALWFRLLDEAGFAPRDVPYPVDEHGGEGVMFGGTVRA